MSDCKSYVSEEDIKALKESELHIEHVARSRNIAGEKVLSVTDTIRGEKVTNRTLDGLEELYQNALSNIGYQQMGDYKPGITINVRNQIVFENGSWYIYRGDLPHVTNGATLTEDGGIYSETNPDGLWVDIGDASLRSELAQEGGASIIGTESGNSLQSVITKLSKGYLSENGGDLQALVNSVTDVFIDEDIDIKTDIVIPSNTNIKTINGAKIHFKNGRIRTSVISPATYYGDNTDNKQIALSSGLNAGESTLKLQSTSALKAGDKLVLKNGYCDMWRVLETSNKALQAVEKQVYKSEIVDVISVSEGMATISPAKYSYPLTPLTYGFIENENSLTQYIGLNRPSATRLLYSNISLDIDIIIHSEQSTDIALLSYVDNVDVTIRSKCNANNVTAFVITMSDNVNVHDIYGHGHFGKFVGVQETCRGSMAKLKMSAWKGGGDTPFLAFVMSSVSIDDVNVESSVKHYGSSAAYINTCDGGSISNVTSKNLHKVIDFSFSRAVMANNLKGFNADYVAGGHDSVECSVDNAVVSGYCFLNASSSHYDKVLIPSFYTINNSFSNIRRVNDEGFGRVLSENTIGLTLYNVQSEKTLFNIFIKGKIDEIAQGKNALVVNADSCFFGKILRQSKFYDAYNESSKEYPHVLINNTKIDSDALLGGLFNPLDKYNIHSGGKIEVGSSCYGVNISGFASSITIASGTNKATCIPSVDGLSLMNKPTAGEFLDLDTALSGSGSIGQTYYNGDTVTDIYNRTVWVNTGVRGAVKWQKR